VKFYLGVTDTNWFNYLSRLYNPEDINFWQPGGNAPFKVLSPGAPFLFKLKSPFNVIGGIGFFVRHTFMPISFAWQAFGNRNGHGSFGELRSAIASYRKQNKPEPDPIIGCIILTDPIFFKREDWIPQPEDWYRGQQKGKSYSTDDLIGRELWERVEANLQKYRFYEKVEKKNQLMLDTKETAQYSSILARVRIGQAAFRTMITDAYERRCAVTGERTLPVLEAAHIKPYAESGPHYISNGLLLRADLHKLFDTGYLTVTGDYSVEKSRRIREEFDNGREYEKHHGKKLIVLPKREVDKPSAEFLQWHNERVFRG